MEETLRKPSNQECETEYLRPVQRKGGNPLLHANTTVYINRRSMAWPGSTVGEQIMIWLAIFFQ